MASDRYGNGNPDFSYENLTQKLIKEGKKSIFVSPYIARRIGENESNPFNTGDKFYLIQHINDSHKEGFAANSQGELIHQAKLKFHISLLEDDRQKFARGWDIVKDILVEAQVDAFKIVSDKYHMSLIPAQRGKDITISCVNMQHKGMNFWHGIIQRITEELIRADIAPGYRQETKEQAAANSGHENKRAESGYISGCNYVSYRCETEDILAEKKGEEKENLEKIIGQVNQMVSEININVSGQKNPKYWNEPLTLENAASASKPASSAGGTGIEIIGESSGSISKERDDIQDTTEEEAKSPKKTTNRGCCKCISM